LAAESDHPFMVHAHAMFQDNKRIYFAMEFVSGGDLMFHIQNNPFSVDSCRFYAAQLVLILEFLHENGILYRDLKLDNVLVGPDGYIKLADYGLCKPGMTEKSLTRTFCGTPEFMAPEILLDQPYSLAVDYWAFGVLLYQMLECRSPFYGNNEKETFQSILRGKLHFSADTDKAGKILITKLLARDPLERLGIKDGRGWTAIREHAFFEGMDWSRLLARQLPSPMLPHTDSPEDVSNFDETFTTEDITLTPYHSLILPNK
jgi:serine/threonine protein kinase